MKLLKKLLPIASVAGIATVVTPLVTSCGSGMMKFDGDSVYIPDIAPAESTKKIGDDYTDTEAAKLYFSDLASNPEIFAQDMYHCISYKLFMAKAQSIAQFAEPKIDIKLKYSNIQVNQKKQMLSYEIKLEGNVYLPNESDTLCAEDLEMHIWFNNIPYECYSSYEKYAWNVYPSLHFGKDASIRFISNGTIISDELAYKFLGLEITLDEKFDPTPTEEKEAGATMGIIEMFFADMGRAYSYHLSQIPHET